MQDGVALVLLVLGVALGVVGNWIKPPQRLAGRWIVGIFAFLLVSAAVLTYLSGKLPAAEGGSSVEGSETDKGRSPYISSDNFQRFGGRHGPFTLVTDETAMRIKTPDSMDSQWGVYLKDHVTCDGSIEFDVKLEPGTVDYYGLAVLLRGTLDNDQPAGDAMMFFLGSGNEFIAKFSSLPTPGVGAVGSGAYPVADLRKTRHVAVAVKGGVHTVMVDGIPAGDFAESENGGCGQVMIAVWGGTTAHIDNVTIR